jgi:hypothetical protein
MVEHERCPEHGELIHAEPGPAASGLEAAAGQASRASALPEPAAAPSNGAARDGHDPCALTAALRQRPGELVDALQQEPPLRLLPRELERTPVAGQRLVAAPETAEHIGPSGVKEEIVVELAAGGEAVEDGERYG